MSLLNSLSKDITNIVYRKLHSHFVNNLNEEYHSKVKIVTTGLLEETYHYVSRYCTVPTSSNRFNWRDLNGTSSFLSDCLYKIKGDIQGYYLPKRYLYSTLKSDMIEDVFIKQ